MTIFNVPNYGALLQCYSLCRYLEELGHDVFLYDIPFYTSNPIIHRIKHAFTNRFMHDFIENYLPEISSDLTEKADLYMVGSDQVWNLDIVGKNYPYYMLEFAPKGSRKVSYSSSFGVDSWKWEKDKSLACKLLADFSKITVRESSGVSILKKTFGLNCVSHVLDPCFLLKDTDIIFSKCSDVTNNLVAFKLVESPNWHKNLLTLNESLGTSLCELNGKKYNCFGELKGFNRKKVDVIEWIKTISTARYVVTDSFHGAVFCVLCKKDFVVVPGLENRMTRLISLLDLLDLSDRYVVIEDAKEKLQKSIDYDSVYEKLTHLIRESKMELETMLV